MTSKTFIAILLTVVIAAAIIPVYASGVCIGTCIDGDANKPCIFCFDPIRHSNTDGYDPQFLKQTEVKTTCQDAYNHGVKFGYCDKSLGTL